MSLKEHRMRFGNRTIIFLVRATGLEVKNINPEPPTEQREHWFRQARVFAENYIRRKQKKKQRDAPGLF
jgi:hypothetical protein